MDKLQTIPKELLSSTLNLDYKTPMSTVSSSLKNYSAVIINKDKEYYGIVDSRTIYRAMQGLKLGNNEKVERFSVKVPKITNSTPIYDVIYYFYESGVKALPYSNGKKITAVLERKTLLKILLSLNILEKMKVNEAMTTPVLAIESKSNISQAKSTMRDRKVNRLIVLENNKFAGILTNYDIVKHYAKNGERRPEMKDRGYNPSNIPVSSVMEREALSIEYNRSLSEAVRDMVENKVSSLVVLRKGNPIGILTVTDVFENIIAKKRVDEQKIFMSGFDDNTYQYEENAMEELKSFVSNVEKLSGIDVDYLTFKVKRSKTKYYEMQIRLSLGRHGIISMHELNYLFEDALNELLKKLKHKVIKEKESIIAHRRINTSREEIE